MDPLYSSRPFKPWVLFFFFYYCCLFYFFLSSSTDESAHGPSVLSLLTAVGSIGGGIPLLCFQLNVLYVVSLSSVVQKLFSQLSVLLQEELLYT